MSILAAHVTTGLASNPIVVATLAIAALALLGALSYLPRICRSRRRPALPPAQPSHVRVIPPEPRSERGPYDPGAFTIGPDERNSR